MHLHAAEFKNRKTFIMMVGLPGSGKGFWINQFLTTIVKDDRDSWLALGTDDIFEEWAVRDGITYSEAFHRYDFKDVEREFKRRINEAFVNNQSVIWDQTNMSDAARGKRLRGVPSDYYKMAVIVTVPDNTLNEQLVKRERETNGGKVIPPYVIENMARSYVRPYKAEGFDRIIDVKR